MPQLAEHSPTNPVRISRMLLNISILSLVAVTALVYPLVSEIDPWHGHVVIGTVNSGDRALALLDHRHTSDEPHSHEANPQSDQSVVLSFAERAMLSTLSDFAGATALVPGHTLPILTLWLILSLAIVALPMVPKPGQAPPSPPPR